MLTDRLCGLVVRVSGYRYRGLGSVRMKQLGSHWTDFYEIRYEDFSKNCPENSSCIQI